MNRLSRLAILLLAFGGLWIGWTYRDFLVSFYQSQLAPRIQKIEQPTPQPERYQELIDELQGKRELLAQRYAEARTAKEISQIVSESRQVLEAMLPTMMRCWLGTPWDFHGTCERPGSGKIACGYFVSTVLRDAGFQVERFALAQQASQSIIRTFLPSSELRVRVGMDYQKFLNETQAGGSGILIVGLDRHVGFLVVPPGDGEIRFIHASGAAAKSVVDEGRGEASVLENSQYRVTGNLTAHPDVIHRWLTKEAWPTHR